MTGKQPEKFSVRKRASSFKYAFSGLRELFRLEHNSWIHLTAAVAVVIAGTCYGIADYEWALVILAIGLVFAAEIFNSAIERIVDQMSPERTENGRIIKDLAAAAVLVCAITAVIIGWCVFGSYVFAL